MLLLFTGLLHIYVYLYVMDTDTDGSQVYQKKFYLTLEKGSTLNGENLYPV